MENTKSMTNNHEKRLPRIVLTAECGSVGAGSTAGRGKVSVDYWTTSKGDNKRPSGAERGEARLMNVFTEQLSWQPTDGSGILKIHGAADGFTYTSATPAIFRNHSNQHTNSSQSQSPTEMIIITLFITIPILTISHRLFIYIIAFIARRNHAAAGNWSRPDQ